jgi:DNA polymerase I - 3''-5'' exonuclease and polymerase domains
MAKITVPVYSEQAMTADAQKIIAQVVAEFPPNTFEFVEIGQGNVSGNSVLVFGKMSPGPGIVAPLIYTYSIAQMCTKANAASVLKSALNQFYLPQKAHPKKVGPWRSLTSFDLDKPIAVDIETSGNLGKTHTPEDVELLTIAFYQENMWCMWVIGMGETITDEMREQLRSVKYPIFHNGKFDMRVIEKQTGVKMSMYFDTMLAHHVLNQGAGLHKLKDLARQYLGAPEWEADLSKYTKGGGHYELIPTQLLTEYNAWDVYWTYELWKFLEPLILADEHHMMAFNLEMAASDLLLEVEQFGFKVDVPYLKQLATDMQNDVTSYLQMLRAITLNPNFNPNSWQQVQKFLDSQGYTVASTDEEHLLALSSKLRKVISPQDTVTVSFIENLLKYRGIRKALSTYVEGVLDKERNGRVHTTFLIHGTTTGRLSSSRPNIQNIPRDKTYRKAFIG